MGQDANTEVYGLFAAAIPQAGRARLQNLPARKRHGLVPDFLMRVKLPESGPMEYLLELKCVHLARSHYRITDNINDNDGYCPAVARRAREVPKDYIRKAQHADRTYCGTIPGRIGPIERRLRSYQRVVPLVFGAFGEASEGVELMISQLAHAGGAIHWRRMKARSPEEASGALAWMLRRRWGIVALREAARLTLDRLQYAGSNRAQLGARTAALKAAAANSERRYKARADALDFSSLGPGLFDTRPLVATRFCWG